MRSHKSHDRNKRFIITVLSGLMTCLILVGGGTTWIDPYFHYHGPVEGLEYRLKQNRQRYINDGITRNFEYDAIITGTSMIHQFKTSEFDKIFGVNSIKVPFTGARFKEVNDNLQKGLSTHKDVSIVLRCLDYTYILVEKDVRRDDAVYPDYLYDNNLFNDVEYLFNKEIFLGDVVDVLAWTNAGKKTTTFDEYSFSTNHKYGKDEVLKSFKRPAFQKPEVMLTQEEKVIIKDNMQQNVIQIAKDNPGVKFYLYFPIYNICYYDVQKLNGELKRTFDIERTAIEEILNSGCDNIKLFSFSDKYEITCSLEYYMDISHSSDIINSKILQWIYEGEGELKSNNYLDYLNRCYEFYSQYDYDSIYK